MELHTNFQNVCRTVDEIPVAARQRIRPEVMTALGGIVSDMFPDFARAFPLTVASLQRHWPKPVIVCRKHIQFKDWITHIVLDREDANLFFDFVSANQDIGGKILTTTGRYCRSDGSSSIAGSIRFVLSSRQYLACAGRTPHSPGHRAGIWRITSKST